MSGAIKKAIIPVAGLGTRFLPVTKSVPKELLPIVDTPILLLNIEEALAAGIEDFILIQGRGKGAIEDFFDVSVELEETLQKNNKLHLIDRVKNVRETANFIFIRQKKPLGLGHAIYTGEAGVGQCPFAVLLGDELLYHENPESGALFELSQSFSATGASAVSLMTVPESDVHKYGIVKAEKVNDFEYKILDVIEKPSSSSAPSNLALPGRYIFDPVIFKYLKNTKPGKNGEIQLTDAMVEVAKSNGLTGIDIKKSHSIRYDAGDKLGYLKANVEFALRNPELRNDFKNYLIELTENLKKL